MKQIVKICGITTAADALEAADAGAEYLGLIFEPESPRAVSLNDAAAIVKAVGGRAKFVGVFVNQDAEFIRRAAQTLGLFAVQLHGGQSAEFAESLRGICAEIWKVVWLESEADLAEAEKFEAHKILVDARRGAKLGGTGAKSNWELAARLAKKRPVVLAGGISPENARAASQTVSPYVLDVNSGVEESPRKKDISKIKKLFKELENK